tara:strand:- start:259 stop:801 length:543 start_codon:yes stop_codon:yes gene_type:complete
MNFDNEMKINLSDLVNFIYRSKKQCFANSEIKISQSDGSSFYSHREFPWLYTDTYNGNIIERGTEDIYVDMVLFWSNQYRGGTLEKFWDKSRAISQFLKKALIETPEEFPIRGPTYFTLNNFKFNDHTFKGELVYTNKWNGDILKFTGQERIRWNGTNVFYHDYMGGLTKNRYFKTKVEQ